MRGMMDYRGFGVTYNSVNSINLKNHLIGIFLDLKHRSLIKDFHIQENGSFEIIPNYSICESNELGDQMGDIESLVYDIEKSVE